MYRSHQNRSDLIIAYERVINAMRNLKILNCPFCGSKPNVLNDKRYLRNSEESIMYFAKKWNIMPNIVPHEVDAYEVVCSNNNCIIAHANSKFFLSPEDAIAVWNKRV